MQLFPVSVVIALLFLLAVRGGLERGAFLAIVLLPFGMTAFAILVSMGNLSLPASQVVAGCTIGLMVLRHLARNPLGIVRVWDRQTWPLALLAVYAVFSGTVLVRVFERDVYVVPLNKIEDGVRLSPLFGSRAELLEVGASNVSQMFYLVFSIAFFFLCRAVLTRRGTGFAHRALVAAACVNLVLGLLDFLGQDWLLNFFRTAKYALLDTHAVAGMPRVIGGFPEASAFGAFSVVLAAYFAAHYLYGGERRSAALAFGSTVASVAAFSSTSYLGLGVATVALLLGAAVSFLRRAVPTRHLVVLHVAVLGALALAFVHFVTGIPDVVTEVLDKLLFDKADSSSGLERAAWAEMALRAFDESHYLGVGVGSIRGNGLASVYLGSVGVPGAFLLSLFLLRTLRGPEPVAPDGGTIPAARATANGARLALVTWLATALASATTPDPGLLAMLFCGILAVPAAMTASPLRAGRSPEGMPTVPAAPFPLPSSAPLQLEAAPFIHLGAPVAFIHLGEPVAASPGTGGPTDGPVPGDVRDGPSRCDAHAAASAGPEPVDPSSHAPSGSSEKDVPPRREVVV